MRWLALSLAGPSLWALVFVAVYGLHGALCAGLGATGAGAGTGPEASGQGARLGLLGAWLAGIAAFWPLFRTTAPAAGGELGASLPRAGAWIGLGATLFTLFPVALTTSC